MHHLLNEAGTISCAKSSGTSACCAMPSVTESETVMAKLVSLIRLVPWGPTRDSLEETSRRLRAEARYERGMCDNHHTANQLHDMADLFLFAAQARFPRAGDTMVATMTARVKADLCAQTAVLS